MRKTFILVLFVAAFTTTLSAQKYTTAAGVRMGSGIGLTVQQHLWDKYTMEGIVQKNLFKAGTNVAALFESHNKLVFKGLNFYIGAGPHAGFYPSTTTFNEKGENITTSNNSFGVSGIAGIEMRFKRLVISYDYQPGVNIHGGDNVFNSQTGFSLRYILIKPKKEEKKWMIWKRLGQNNR